MDLTIGKFYKNRLGIVMATNGHPESEDCFCGVGIAGYYDSGFIRKDLDLKSFTELTDNEIEKLISILKSNVPLSTHMSIIDSILRG